VGGAPAALVVGREHERRAGIPGRLAGEHHDLREDFLGLGALPRLEHVGRARELGVEIGRDGLRADVGVNGNGRCQNQRKQGEPPSD